MGNFYAVTLWQVVTVLANGFTHWTSYAEQSRALEIAKDASSHPYVVQSYVREWHADGSIELPMARFEHGRRLQHA